MAKKMVYEWTDGSRASSGIAAQAAGEILETISKANGGVIQPPDVVNAAKPKSSPIHNAFEWNDSIAAEQFRLQQARALINSISVVVKIGNADTVPTRAFVNMRHTEQGQGYVTIKDGLTKPEYRDQVLAEALTEIKSWQARYKQLSELSRIFEAIEEIELVA